MTNPTITNSTGVKGVCLLPYKGNGMADKDQRVLIQAQGIDFDQPISAEVFELPTRYSKVAVFGAFHGIEGTISGLLVKRDGLTADQWRLRLNTLVRQQQSWARIELLTPDKRVERVVLAEGFRISQTPNPELVYDVEIPFVEVFEGR